MSNPSPRVAALSLVLLGVTLALGSPVAHAQTVEPPAEPDAQCVACHQDLYFRYDTGKWHCLCAASPGCIHCHGGQPDTADEAQAHAGMIANPLQNDAAVCQECHCDDCQERVDEFMALAGGTVTSGRGRTYPTPGPEPTLPPAGLQIARWPERLREPWRAALLGLAGAGLVGLGLYGARCCLDERRTPAPR
jgi:hypothetical protein